MGLDVFDTQPALDRKTKIVATIGPSTVPKVEELIQAGMNVARINCSHGDRDYYESVLNAVESAVGRICARGSVDFRDGAREDVCATAFDTKGPEIRTGRLRADPDAEEGSQPQLTIRRGDSVVLTVDQAAEADGCLETGVFVDYPQLVDDVRPGSDIFVDDGLLGLRVDRVERDSGRVFCTAESSAELGERKGISIPGVDVALPAVSDKDRVDLQTARELGADMVFASFIRDAGQVDEIRELVGPNVAIISKIENQTGIGNFDSILEASDGIMVARGDLGVEIPLERVWLAQKRMIARANLKGKPVITATQMLESMTTNPRPTRAEVVDVANAVLDGTDCVMLSGETAKGRFPVESIQTMTRICRLAEAGCDPRESFDALSRVMRAERLAAGDDHVVATHYALASSAVHASFEQDANAILVVTRSGRTAELLARCRPAAPIIAISPSAAVARRLQLFRGVHALLAGEDTVKRMVDRAITMTCAMGVCSPGDRVIALFGNEQRPTRGDVSSLHVMHVSEKHAQQP